MRKLLIANWKENPGTRSAAMALFLATARAKKNHDAVVCPPFIYLEDIAAKFKNLRLKQNLALVAQDIFWQENGAFTGAVGPKMIRSLNARYVIIGHSERRRYLKETDAMVNKKVRAALNDDLIVILCVGESENIRNKGMRAAEAFIKNQLKKGLSGVSPAAIKSGRVIIAYEPIWAIGTGNNDSPKDAVAMAKFIKKSLKVGSSGRLKILYGGSVNSKNIADFVQYKEIGGALVGGASLNAKEFEKMLATRA